jgi:hypothetical protein
MTRFRIKTMTPEQLTHLLTQVVAFFDSPRAVKDMTNAEQFEGLDRDDLKMMRQTALNAGYLEIANTRSTSAQALKVTKQGRQFIRQYTGELEGA